MRVLNDVILKVHSVHKGGSIFLTSSRRDYFSNIKQRLEKSVSIPKRDQILYFGCCLIDDSLSVGELIDSDAKMIEISLDISVNGGAQNMEPIDAPDMTSEDCFELKDFGYGPYYLAVGKGITFEGICRSMNCDALNRTVCVMLDMCEESNNICCYSEYMFELKCPACNTLVEPDDISNVIFYDCTVKVKFKKVFEARPKEYEMVAPSDKYLTLKNAQEMLRYNYIQFTLK